jgi:hypothetical protein
LSNPRIEGRVVRVWWVVNLLLVRDAIIFLYFLFPSLMGKSAGISQFTLPLNRNIFTFGIEFAEDGFVVGERGI